MNCSVTQDVVSREGTGEEFAISEMKTLVFQGIIVIENCGASKTSEFTTAKYVIFIYTSAPRLACGSQTWLGLLLGGLSS